MAMSTAWLGPVVRQRDHSASTGPVVGIAGTPDGQGYWVATANGGVSAFGDAQSYGDLPALGKHVTDIVAITGTADGKGYYLVGADGGFFTFGDAKFYGSLPGIHVHTQHVVGMVGLTGRHRLPAGGLGRRRVHFWHLHFLRFFARHNIHVTNIRARCRFDWVGLRACRLRRGRFLFWHWGQVLWLGTWTGHPRGQHRRASPLLPMTAAIGWSATMAACTASATLRYRGYPMAYRATCPEP